MSVRGSRLARLLKVIALLRGPSSWNARRLAEHFGTSKRNVLRDILVLKMAGVPVYRDEEHGEGGGYRIDRGWFFPHVGLTDQECLDLAIMARVAETKSIPLVEAMSEVRDKLLATLPGKQQDLIRESSDLFAVLSLGLADHKHTTQIMLNLQKALLTKKQVSGLYCSPHEKKTKRIELQPRRVFLARQSWYLAAYDNAAHKTKLYRLSRFKELKVLDKPVTIAQGWSLREFLGNAWTVMRGSRDYYVEVRFNADAAPLVSEVRWHHTQELIAQQDGSLIFRATVSGLEEIRYWVLSWGPQAVVLKPRELSDDIRRLANDTLRNYAQSPIK